MKQDANTTLGQRLKTLRIQKELSQTELGNLASVHYTHIGKYEKGLSIPATGTLQKLSEALDTTTDYLLEGATDDLAIDRLSDKELLAQFQVVEKFPEEDKAIIKRLIGSFIAEKRLQEIVAR